MEIFHTSKIIVGNVEAETEACPYCGKIGCLTDEWIIEETAKPIKVKLIGIDSWNRPVFRDIREDKNEFYGSVDILCDFSDTETDILEKVTAKDLCYFGTSFGCEPDGDPAEVEIVPNPPKVVKPKREVFRAIVYRRGNDWILSDGEKDNDDPDLDIPYWIAEKEEVKKHLKEALEKKYPGKYRLKMIWVNV
jgi:hypothetical protein